MLRSGARKIVRHGVAEGFELADCRLQLHRPLAHPLLEFGGQPALLVLRLRELALDQALRGDVMQRDQHRQLAVELNRVRDDVDARLLLESRCCRSRLPQGVRVPA